MTSIISVSAFANPAGISISGYIEDIDAGTPIAEKNVDFYISVLSPDGCVLYTEKHLAKDLSNNPGSFSLMIGEGVAAVNAYSTTTPQSFSNFVKVFNNDSTLVTGLSGSSTGECANSQYQPALLDSRKIKLEFDVNDGLGHHVLSDYTAFKSVPYAHIAYTSSKLGGKSAEDFVQVDPTIANYQARVDALVSDSGNAVMSQVLGGTYVAPSATTATTATSATTANTANTAASFATTPTGCPAGQYASGIAANGNLTCSTPAGGGGGGGSGTVTGVTSANTDISVATGTTTPVLTLNSGTTANQILKLDGAAKIPAVDGSQLTSLNPANLSAAVPLNKGGTGATTQPAAATAILPTQIGNSGKYLTTDGAGNVTWATATASGGSASTVTGTFAGDVTGTQSAMVVEKIRGTNVVVTTPTNGQVLQFDGTNWVPTTPSSAASNNTLVQRDVTGVSGFYGVDISGATSGGVTLQSPTTVTSYSLTLPAAQGGANTVLSNNGSGALSWVNALTNSLTSAQIFVGNGSNVATGVAMSGDATIANTGALTITSSAVTNAKMANMAAGTLKGNVTGGAAAPTDITIASLQGTTSSTFAAGNDSRIINAIQNSGSGASSNIISMTAGLDAAKPSSGWIAGRIYMATDTQKIYRDNGTGLDVIASAGGSGGTVTSVGLSLPAEFTVTNSPQTSSGTLTGAWASQTTNKVFASPNGSTGAPSFRALTTADITSGSLGALI